jgi:hypothetical protein
MSRLGELLSRFRAGRDRVALEKAEDEQYDSPAERRIAEEDYEAKKDDLHVKEYLPGVDDDL